MIYLKNEEATQFHTTNTAIALGKFDGIHIGHQQLIEGLKFQQSIGRQALVFSFGDVQQNKTHICGNKMIYTKEEKAYYFEAFGMDILLEFPFTEEFSSYSPELFVKNILVEQLGVKAVYVGEDFRFGRERSGNVSLLKKYGSQYGFEVHAIKKIAKNGKIVSSTRIRDCIVENICEANNLLGAPYFVYGKVIHGKHLGHKIGFPTINQEIPKQKLIPTYGVYASKIYIDGESYQGISNLGVKPTVTGEHQVGLETHILDYDGDLYDKRIKTELLFFIRPEQKFSDVNELKIQIQRDIDCMIHRTI